MLIHVYTPFSYYREPSYHTYYHILLFFTHIYFPASGQAVVTGVVPFPPRFLPSIFIAHRVQQSHCARRFFYRMLLTHSPALSASQFVLEKKSQLNYTSVHSAGLELTKLTYLYQARDNLIRHRGDRLYHIISRRRTTWVLHFNTI